MYPRSSGVWVGVLTMKTSRCWAPVHQSSHQFLIVKMMMDFCHSFGIFIGPKSPLSQRQTSNGMTKPILYHKTHTAWHKSYCMSFAMPSYFPWIHGKTHVISAPPYPWLFPCSNLSLVSQLFAFDSTF